MSYKKMLKRYEKMSDEHRHEQQLYEDWQFENHRLMQYKPNSSGCIGQAAYGLEDNSPLTMDYANAQRFIANVHYRKGHLNDFFTNDNPDWNRALTEARNGATPPPF